MNRKGWCFETSLNTENWFTGPSYMLLHFGWPCDLSEEGLRVCYLMVMVAQADADGATGAGQDGCHGVEVN